MTPKLKDRSPGLLAGCLLLFLLFGCVGVEALSIRERSEQREHGRTLQSQSRTPYRLLDRFLGVQLSRKLFSGVNSSFESVLLEDHGGLQHLKPLLKPLLKPDFKVVDAGGGYLGRRSFILSDEHGWSHPSRDVTTPSLGELNEAGVASEDEAPIPTVTHEDLIASQLTHDDEKALKVIVFFAITLWIVVFGVLL